ncbi:Elongation of fatty acids protein sre1 [Dictyocoela muelleri]|nr:Elongation of fatty acids protein sre1 [Dictyocoela muelleri]
MEGLYELSLNWRTPLTIAIIYIIYVKYMNNKILSAKPFKRELKSFLTFSMVFHNLAMSAYSLYSTMKVVPEIIHHYKIQTFHDFLSDRQMLLKTKIDFYIWLFYVSKYYELVDTIILHLNRKQASFLQTYHHAGAILSTFLFTKANSHLGWIFVALNSIVHTIMYLYYAFTCIGIRFRYKYFITNMQIIQFLTGIFLLIIHVAFVDALPAAFDKFAFGCNLIYVLILLYLFSQFSKKTYGVKKKKD